MTELTDERISADEWVVLNRLLAFHAERSTSLVYPTRHLERLVKRLAGMTDDEFAAFAADVAVLLDVTDRHIRDLIDREQNTRLYEISSKFQSERLARLRRAADRSAAA